MFWIFGIPMIVGIVIAFFSFFRRPTDVREHARREICNASATSMNTDSEHA